MVLGGPRSATTWAANWLTTDTTLCLHDPLLEFTRQDLEQMSLANGKRLGVSCTSSVLWPGWVASLKCPKVILYRDVEEINRSLDALGLVRLNEITHLRRLAVFGDTIPIFPYQQLFAPTGAKVIAEILGVPFDMGRHNLLRQMRIEPHWKHLTVGKQAAGELIDKIIEAQRDGEPVGELKQ